MKLNRAPCRILRKIFAAVLCVMVALLGMPAPYAFAQEPQQIIRVGRFPYDEQLQVDANGNYSGYGYDYLQELARYTGWQYEFVDAPWNECLAMLERGDVDLMGALMRSPEREIRFDFSAIPMVSGYGVLATALDNQALPYEDFKAFNGLRVGVVKGNQHANTFLAYSQAHDCTPVLYFYDTQADLDTALASGEIDAIIATNILRSQTLRVVAAFAENDAYFATTKGNSKVLTPLNQAMRQIRLHDPYFNSKLEQKYFDLQASTAISFTREELNFIQNSDPIPCSYIPQAPPFTAYSQSSGSVQGIAIDICRLIEQRTGLTFQWLEPVSASKAADLLRSGEALLLPAKYDDPIWAIRNNARLTEPYLLGQMVMVNSGQPFATEIAALYENDPQGSQVAYSVSGAAQIKNYDTIEDCMDAVLDGEATTTYINAITASYFLSNPKYFSLRTTTLYGYPANIAMAVSNTADPLLLSVLNKGMRSISTTEINQSLLLHMRQTQISPLAARLYQNPLQIILLVVGCFTALLLTLLFLLHKMQKTLYTDALTGHPNYRALSRDAVRLIGSRPEQYVLVYMDIRRFKVINDTFGYAAGDSVLKATADALLDFTAHNERTARIHADVFVMLLHRDEQITLQARLDMLSARLSQLTFAQSDKIKPLYKGGVYPLNKDFDNLEVAFDRAHYAKDSITHLFANTFAFYDDVIHLRALQEKELEDSMYTALNNREFVPYYQPKVNAVTEKVIGAEALVRWLHPQKGCLSPSEFIPFYEKNGFIVNIDLAVFEQVCRDISQWMGAGAAVVPISVNLSRRNIQNKELPHRLKEIADQYHVPPHLIELEITETEELEDLEDAVAFVENLQTYGFIISVDDYGTGYSSISFLQRLPMDALKLDRQFILNAMQSGKAEDIMRYLVSTMRKNRIRIFCEGIETEKQRDFVIGLDCRFIQGFLYSQPLPRMAFESYLQKHGVELSGHLDDIPMIDFENNRLIGVEDFLSRSMPSWVFSCLDQPGYPVVYMSPNLLAELGYGQLEFKMATDGLYANVMHPDDLSRAPVLQEPRDSTQDTTLQYRLRRKDGSYLWVREVNKRVLTADGREALLCVCTNITDIMTLEQEMQTDQDTGTERAKLELALSLTGHTVLAYNIRTKAISLYNGSPAFSVSDGTALSSIKNLIQSGHIYPEDAQKLPTTIDELMLQPMPVSYEIRVCAQGVASVYRWKRITLKLIADKLGEPSSVVGVVEDIDQQKRFEYAFQQEAQYREAFTESSLMAYEINLTQDTIQRISGSRGFRLEEVCRSTQHPYRYSEGIVLAVSLLVAVEDRAMFLQELSREGLLKLYQNRVFQKELEYRRFTWDNQIIWTSVLIYLLMDQLNGEVVAYAYHRDINERKMAEQELIEQAERDPLTGTLNRVTAELRIQEFLSQPSKPGSVHAFFMLDLNRFKAINDSCGHLMGDKCLVKLAQILQANVQPGDIVARMGGDEFSLFLIDRPNKDVVHAVADKIAQEFAVIAQELDIDLSTGVSIGIALAPQHGTDFESLYRHADKEMYFAKSTNNVDEENETAG